MKARVGENKKAALLGLLTVLAAIVLLPAFVGADTFPYFNITQGSVFSGGGFYANPTTACQTNDLDYQSPDFSSLANLGASAKTAGILAYGTQSSGTGANSSLSAQALGLIESDSGASSPGLDFFSGPQAATNPHYLNFANDLTGSAQPSYSTNYGGGFYSGTNGIPFCIFDYYDGFLPAGTVPNAGNSITTAGLAAGSLLYQPASGLLTVNSAGASTFPTGQDTTIFVKGDLLIRNNVTYTTGTDATPSSATKLAFVVQGNIYVYPYVGVGNGTTTMDGLFIAQPKTLADTASGFFYTCSDGINATPANPPISSWIMQHCETGGAAGKLSVNGAVIDKWTVLDREVCGLLSGLCPASPGETFNFTNEMTLGGPFFSQSPPTGTTTLDSLVSLPPVF